MSTNGRLTYQSLDSIDGGAGTDTLFVQVDTTAAALALTPTRTSNVENFEVSNIGTANALTLSLEQVSGVQSVSVAGSTATTNVTNVSNAQAAFSSQGTNANVAFTIANSALAGSDTVNLTVDGHVGTMAINSTGTNAIEGLALTATGGQSTIATLNVGSNAGATITSLNVTGDAIVTLGAAGTELASVTSLDASGATGGLTAWLSGGNVTATGGAGNDTFDVAASVGNVNLTGGAGNDTFVFGRVAGALNTLTTADTVTGGDGAADTLQALSAGLTGYVKPATATITGIETLRVMDALAGNLTTSNVQSGITAVQLDTGTGGNTVTFDSAVDATLRLNAIAGAAIAVTSAGVGTADSVTIKNVTTATDVFDGRAITATGVETLTLDGGTTTTRVTQDINTIGATSGATAVKFVGNNAFTLAGAVTAGSVDASGMTGTGALTMVAGQVGVTSITGTANADTLFGRATAATTISGGSGNDSITGGTAADSISGGDGADLITAGGGNDTVQAGAGNDTVVTTGALTNLMTFDGGDGTLDALAIDTVATAGLANTTNFEILRLDAGLVQSMSVFTGTTFNRVDLATGASTISNASSNVSTLRVDDAVTNVEFSRLVNTTTDALTVGARESENTTVTLLIVNNEDTLTFGQGAILEQTPALTLTITDLDAIDVDTINITGAQNTSVRLRADGAATGFGAGTTARAIVVNASEATGTVNYDSGNSASTLYTQTITGSSIGNNTLIGGGGADSITGGNGTNVLTGGGGNDTLTGGTSSDTLTGGLGADSIVGGTGTDVYSAAGTNGVADGGLINSLGQVINLGATTLTNAAIAAATNGALAANDGALAASIGSAGVATNQAAYLFTASTGGAGGASFIDSLSGIENVTGSAGRDYIVGSSAANTITGAAGADVMTGGAGATVVDTFVQGNADSVVFTAKSRAEGAAWANNDTITFGNDVDYITDFGSVDLIDTAGTAAIPTTLVALNSDAVLTANTIYGVRGEYVQTTGVFTIDTAGGTDFLVVNGTGTALAANAGVLILEGVTSLAAANFV